MKVAFCSSEVVPFAKTGGLADVCGALPIALENLGMEVSVMMPFYRGISGNGVPIKRLNKGVAMTKMGKDIQVYFIEHEEYFDREGLYGSQSGDYQDNLDRFQFYCQKVLAILKQLNLKVDIIHCHDWQSSLIPVYLRHLVETDEFYKNMKSVLTIHNLAFQGIFPKEDYPKLQLDPQLFTMEGLEFYDQVNFLKGGINFSDAVTTVSPEYAKEIQTEELGCGLADVLQSRQQKIIGILNGVDDDVWNPETDRLIETKYSVADLSKKRENKKALQQQSHLPVNEDIPVFGFVGRLSYQKGVDLIAQSIEEIMKMELQIIVLGVGEEKYHAILQSLAERFSHQFACHIAFDEKIAHQIYAGSDIFLMPSRYEPCGLSQMISLRYGTVPLVFKTGGLADTIIAHDDASGNGQGFIFTEYNSAAFIEAIQTAHKVFHQKKMFESLMKKAVTHHFSWEASAREYQKVYEQCLKSD